VTPASLSFDIEPVGTDRSKLAETVCFKQEGLFNMVYSYAVLPLHNVVFNGMLHGIARSTEHRDCESSRCASDVTTTLN
jgi:hypothetical protein